MGNGRVERKIQLQIVQEFVSEKIQLGIYYIWINLTAVFYSELIERKRFWHIYEPFLKGHMHCNTYWVLTTDNLHSLFNLTLVMHVPRKNNRYFATEQYALMGGKCSMVGHKSEAHKVSLPARWAQQGNFSPGTEYVLLFLSPSNFG